MSLEERSTYPLTHRFSLRRFGQIGFQRLALDVKRMGKSSDGIAAFIEEGVVRRELSDNFCFYNDDYDSLAGAAGWARDR